MKVAQIINRSLRLLNVLDAAEAAEGEDAATAIEGLNALCTRWEANGLTLGWQNVSNPDDDLPAPDEAELALSYNLALLLAPEYETNAKPAVVDGAARFLADLRRDRMVTNPLKQVAQVPLATSRYWYGRGSY